MTGSSAEEFTAFVGAAGARIERAAFLLTGDHHLAEDLTQATLAKVFAAWRRVKEDPFTYTYRTLVNTYVSHRRLRRNSERPTEWVDDVAGSDLDVASRLDVVRALGTLSPLDRAIVVLRYMDDRTVADTALLVDRTEDVVRARSSRALKRLRPLFENTDSTTSRGHTHD